MSSDSTIMLRRNFKHTLRNPVTVFNAILMPIIMMLMFVYVFGDAFNVGGGDCINYATPGMLILAIVYGLSATAVAISSDMTKGIINRFKVMDVSRGAVLTGHVVSTMVRAALALAAIIAVAFLLGFSPTASFLDWLAAGGVLLLVLLALSWLTVAFGLAAKTQESAGFSASPPCRRSCCRSSAARSSPPTKWAPASRNSPTISCSRRSSNPSAGSSSAHRIPARRWPRSPSRSESRPSATSGPDRTSTSRRSWQRLTPTCQRPLPRRLGEPDLTEAMPRGLSGSHVSRLAD